MTFLLLNQTFHPDVMATGQYLTEVALRLVERGHQVTVITSRRAYDNPATQFAANEMWRGIRICRIGSSGFGKGARWRRAADFASFSAMCALRLIFQPRRDVVVALTSPPLISFLGALVAKLRGGHFVYWVMDFNPDEAIAAGWLRPGSLAAQVLETMSRFSLRQASRIIALDRFMRDRIVAKGNVAEKVAVIPPWSHDLEVRFDPGGRQRFRSAHGLEGKFVVMYSGNHSPCHPLDTLLAAAKRLATDKEIMFCFVGGGSEFRKIEREITRLSQTLPDLTRPTAMSPHILCLPYQPFDQLAGSLSAADLQVVVMGDAFVGLVHPCKIYNILSVGAPVLYIGPRPSHVSEILDGLGGEQIAHGDVDGVVRAIERAKGSSSQRTPDTQVEAAFAQEILLPKLIQVLESQ